MQWIVLSFVQIEKLCMVTLQEERILAALNRDQIIKTDVGSHFLRRKLRCKEGHTKLTLAEPHTLKKKILNYLSKVIVLVSKEWDHFSRVEKGQEINCIVKVKE